MSETVQQYIDRLLGYVEGKQPLEVLTTTAGQVERLTSGLSPAELGKRPAPTKWSVTEILAHLADAEIATANPAAKSASVSRSPPAVRTLRGS